MLKITFSTLALLNDLNENGSLDSEELTAVVKAIVQLDWGFYTQGDARMVEAGFITSFHSANVGAMQPAFKRQSFLRPTQSLALAA